MLSTHFHPYNGILTLSLVNILNEHVHLPFLELSINNFGEIKMKIKKIKQPPAQKALYWWQRLITFGSSKVRFKNLQNSPITSYMELRKTNNFPTNLFTSYNRWRNGEEVSFPHTFHSIFRIAIKSMH